MSNVLLIGGIFLGLLYAKESGHHWMILAVAVFVIVGATVLRLANRMNEQKASYKIVDKKNGWWTLIGTLIIYSLFLGHSLYTLHADLRPYFYVLTIAYLVAIIITENYQIKYLLDETGLTYNNKKITYDQIIKMRLDEKYLIIDTRKYINHIKIEKVLVSEEVTTFLADKIR